MEAARRRTPLHLLPCWSSWTQRCLLTCVTTTCFLRLAPRLVSQSLALVSCYLFAAFSPFSLLLPPCQWRGSPTFWSSGFLLVWARSVLLPRCPQPAVSPPQLFSVLDTLNGCFAGTLESNRETPVTGPRASRPRSIGANTVEPVFVKRKTFYCEVHLHEDRRRGSNLPP